MKISAKLSTIKRLICLALSVILVAGFVPAQAKAADAYIYKVSTLPKNTSVSAIGNQYEPKSTDPYSAAHYEYNYTYNIYNVDYSSIKIKLYNCFCFFTIRRIIDELFSNSNGLFHRLFALQKFN